MFTSASRLVVAAFLLLQAAASMSAQPDLGDDPVSPAGDVTLEELEDFAVAYLEVRVLRAQLDRQINRLISRSGLDRERLSEIQENGLTGVPEREARSYEVLMDQSETVQESYHERMVAAVRATDLSTGRFSTINRALNADRDLAERAQAQIDRILAERSEALDLDFDGSESGE